ncbi:VTC domain-domain-containing protein [Absidia repens]|uniref:VTC domain-domain-containing protein n=1 Tax=Absidia repens TaxID=90262 RepID=A0A1X2IHF9_9FUNG|nr:VTC domain-domain-containing protein [Absidia repens]
MKFEEELNIKTYKPWRHLYVRYSEISAGLDKRSLGWTDKDERSFVETFKQELAKVYDFVDERMVELSRRVEQAETSINDLKRKPQQQKQSSNSNPSTVDNNIKHAYDSLADTLAEILFDINDLSRYHQLNKTALEKLVKQHDKLTRLDLRTKYHGSLLENWPLDKVYFDVLIVRISNMQDICRLKGHPRSRQAYSQGEDQTAFERATSKYWIHPDNITEVKSIILMYLPIHVFNQRKTYEPSDAAVSSVYFDNANYDLYSERLQREEGAEAIRFRWYGAATDDIYIERKTHHAPWLNGSSVKDRFRLKDGQVNAFLKGQYTTDHLINDLTTKTKLDQAAIEQNAFIAKGVQTSVQNRQLKPMCRVFYNRTAFQLPGDQRLRLSLDHNLTFIREDDLDGKARRQQTHSSTIHSGRQEQQQWRRLDIGVDYPFRHIASNDIHRFPYAVLETKIQRHLGQESPPWLDALLNSHLVHEVPRFSKYLHGASQLYKNSVPIMPWWICELEKDIRKQPMVNCGLSRSLSFKPLFNGRHRSSLALADDNNNNASSPTTMTKGTTNDQQQQSKVIPYIAIKLSDPEQDKAANVKSSGINNKHMAYGELHDPSSKSAANGGKGPRDLVSRFWNGKGLLSYSGKGSNKKGADVSAGGLEEGAYHKQIQQQQQPPPARLAGQVKKLDPKAFFANERTFISWLQFCALILTVALNLLNYGDLISRLVGAIFIILASIISIYALFRFQIRAYQMRTGRNILRMDDIYGPAVLCVLLVAALVVNFYLRAPLLTQQDDDATMVTISPQSLD